MRSILIACSQPTDDDPVVSFAADLAARTGAATSLAVVEGARPETLIEQACETSADLIVVSPRIPAASTSIELDRTATRILFRCEPAVLVLRPPVSAVRKILIPLRREDLRRGALAPALEWAERLRRIGGGADAEPAEIQVLHVATDPDEMYEDLPLLRGELERLSASNSGAADVRRFQCVRWGAVPHMRIARWVARHGIDLVILPRHDPRVPSDSQDHTWFHALGVAGRPALLLPLGDGSGTTSRGMSTERSSRVEEPSSPYGRDEAVAAAG